MKNSEPFKTLAVHSEDLERVITKLNLEGRRILSVDFTDDERFVLHLAKRRTGSSQSDIGLSATKGTATPRATD